MIDLVVVGQVRVDIHILMADVTAAVGIDRDHRTAVERIIKRSDLTGFQGIRKGGGERRIC